VIVTGDVGTAIAATVAEALTAINDHRAEGPVPAAMLEATTDVQGTLTDVTVTETATAELATGGAVGVVTTTAGDVIAIADDGSGWEVVGGHFASVGADPWYGESPRRVLVLGSDARPGQSPPVHRMDSIHVLTAAPAETAGAILGYPRDSWVESDYGTMRLNALTTSGRGPDALFSYFTDDWGVPVEGYILTGFRGFADLVDATVGRLEITIPIPIPAQKEFPGFRSGEQNLTGWRTLDFSRTRKLIPGGDFTRSLHHGVVMLAMLTMLQRGEPADVPALLAELSRHTETSLSPADLIQLGLTAMDLDIGSVTNEVLPGQLGRAGGGQSVVFLDPGWERIVDDVIDDGIRNDSAGSAGVDEE
jgi:LCP family protein required for cell wall assembly